jgi:hypothetical protein
MKTKIYAWAFLGAASLVTAISCFAAGVESSGGSLSQVYGNAWFISGAYGQKIKTCYVVSNDFGTAPAKLEAAILQASKTWSSYFLSKNIQTPTRPAGGNGQGKFYFISSDIVLMQACDGSEDLKIYFGAKDAQVQKALLQYDQPYAFSQPTTDSSQLWGKGFIYVATPQEVSSPSWDTGNHLVGVLLHELGHVLGNGHLDNTIMDADLAQQFQLSNSFDTLNQIDQMRELRLCIDCGQTYSGQLTLGDLYNADDAINKLAGKSTHVTAARFVKKDKRDESYHQADNYNLPEGDLLFTDASAGYHFYLKTQSLIASSEVDVPLFMTPESAVFSYDDTFSGVLTRDDGTTFPVTVNVNSDDGLAFEIVLMDGQHFPEKLFVSSAVEAN